jgi:cobalt transporter subunit CbtB
MPTPSQYGNSAEALTPTPAHDTNGTHTVLRSQTVEKPNREYGEDYPSGAEPVTAPATVSGEEPATCHWETGKAAGTSDPRSQETCREHRRNADFIQFSILYRAHGGCKLMTNSTQIAANFSISQRIAAGSLALLLGISLLWGAGFAAQAHDAAHDTRHAIGFPCH